MARAPCRLPACSGPTTQRHRGAVLIPFKEATLQRGRTAFENEGLITVAPSRYDPVIRQRFQGGTRNLYTNRFDTLTRPRGSFPLSSSTLGADMVGHGRFPRLTPRPRCWAGQRRRPPGGMPAVRLRP